MTGIKTGPSTGVESVDHTDQRRWFNIAIVLLILLFLLFLSQVTNLDPLNAKATGFDSLPVSMRASSEANYSLDTHNYSIPPINENILNQIITEIPATGSPQDREGTLQVVLLSPVSTMTPAPKLTLDRRLGTTFTPTLPAPKSTIVVNSPTLSAFTTPVPTATRGLSLTPTVTYPSWTATLPEPTSTPTPQPNTMTPTPSATSTITPIPPNPTIAPKPTKKPKPTKIPKQP